MLPFLSDEIKLDRVNAVASAATSDVSATSVDMAGWEGVFFFASFGTPAANNRLHAEQSDLSASAFEDLAGSEVVPSGASDELQWIDIHRPEKRYVRCVALRGTSSTVESIWAIRYRGRKKPTKALNVVPDTMAGHQLASPAEGTK